MSVLLSTVPSSQHRACLTQELTQKKFLSAIMNEIEKKKKCQRLMRPRKGEKLGALGSCSAIYICSVYILGLFVVFV